jgi:CheY-like chemotaxis protein/HPt (histidine-containing phosphotransfer) domain-containing protein
MSHEIRTPINSILGMNEMILRESTEEPVLEYATDVENAGTTLLALINDILDFSKIESGKLEIIPVEYSVRTMVHDLVNMIEPRARKKGLTLHVEINPNMPNGLIGDDVRVRQIVTNILTNAVKYTEKGSVYLSVDYRRAETGLLLLIKVRDTGIGIRPENLDAIFQSFQRVDEERNRGVEGTGLGLSITSSLLELMDGELRVESEYGKGSIFYITIPQKICSGETVGDFAEELKHDVQKRKKYAASFVAPDAKILVVDDNGMNINVIVQLLKKTRVQLDTALSGRECIEQVQNKQYDLILMDHMMPEMDGVETLSKLKAEMPHFATPVIALTANAVSGAKDQYLSYGFQDYLSKPVRGSALEEKLCEWLPKEKLLDEDDVPEKSDEPTTAAESAEDSGKSDYPEEINFDAALEFSANGKEGVDWNIDAFRENVPEVAESLCASYEAEDWSNYSIHVHGLKSNLACIGAKQLSARAKELELHAKEGDAAFVKEHHASFYADFETLLGKLSGEEKQESERELLERIIEMADDFDAVGVQESIGQLNKQKHHPDMQGGVVLDRLTEAGEKLDFETIKKLANLILHSQSDPT